MLLREIRVTEPCLWKVGSKQAGQAWSETAKLVNAYEEFKEMPRDQQAVRERFNKLMAEFRSNTRAEESATGISPDPPSEMETVHTDKNKK